MKKFVFFVLSLSVILTGCNTRQIYSDYVQLQEGIWAFDKEVCFEVNIDDTTSLYELDLMVRNNESFCKQNLWLSITQQFDTIERTDTVNLFLADENGKWLGVGLGSLKDNSFVWKEHFRFDRRGLYKYTIRHLMRDEVLEGIERVGLSVAKERN